LPAAGILGQIADGQTRSQAADQLIQRIHQAGPNSDDATLQALGLVGGPRAASFLIDLADHGTEVSREKALLALGQGRPDFTVQAAALRLAGDKRAPGKVREGAFQLLEKMPAAVGGLVLLMRDSDERVRWRAVEAALAAGKQNAVVPVLEGLNPAGKYKKEDLDSYVVHDLLLVGPPALAPLKAELASKNAVARQVAQSAVAQIEKR
jgi:HEAT repeat protein